MPIPKESFVNIMRRRYPELEGQSDEVAYILGIKNNPHISVEAWEGVYSPSTEVNTSKSFFDYLDYLGHMVHS